MRTEVLDHGYVELIESWGSDERIVESARMSTQKAFQGWGTPDAPGDEKLLKFLWKNKHATPFEMGGLTIEVKAPILVFREWQRHRTQGYSEMSARYAPLPNENYVPTIERIMLVSKKNKQAGAVAGAEEITEDRAEAFIRNARDVYATLEAYYLEALRSGVPKEVARVILPVGRYSKMRATANLRNWLAFLTLRDEPSAQWEIQQYARVVATMVEAKFPRTYAIFREAAK